MNIRYLLGVTVAGFALSVSLPAAAQDIPRDRDPFEKLDAINPEVLFKGIVREDDVSLLFQHVRESIVASARGEEPKESEAMKRRADEIQREVAVRGSVLVGVLLQAFESAARQMIRDSLSEFSSGNSGARNASRPAASY